MKLRDYQESAEDDVRAAMRIAQAVLLVLGTGGGKTVIFSDIANKAVAMGNRVLILAHRDTLIRQASAKLREYNVDHGVIMAGFTPARHKPVQVASVQTLVRRIKQMVAHAIATYNRVKADALGRGVAEADAEKLALDAKAKCMFDLVIIDEAHLSSAKSYQDIIDAILDCNPKCRILGVTGSPIRLDGRGLRKGAGGLFLEMVRGISIKEMQRRAYLVEIDVYASADKIDLSGIKKVGGEYDPQAIADVMDKPTITGNAIETWLRVCPGVPTLAWCANVKHAENVAAEFRAAGISALALSGESTSEERVQALKKLASGEIKVITFAMLLVEGVDCPAIGAVILLRPTMSLASYLQVIGRGLRPVYAFGMPLDTVEQRRAAIAAGSKGRFCYVLDHAGLTFKHGFADEDRDWSLDGLVKKKGKKKEAVERSDIKQCPKCYRVHDTAPACPRCGHVYPERSSKLEVVDGELTRITEEMREKMAAQARLKQKAAQASAKSVDEMMQQLGYSRGRAEAIVQAREEKTELQQSLLADLHAWQHKTGQTLLGMFGVYTSDLRSYKPKQLKELREKFDRHRAQHEGREATIVDRPGDDSVFGDFMRAALAPNAPGNVAVNL